jgi:FixJ family two-component response regulator
VKLTIYVIDPDPTEQQKIAAALAPEAEAVLLFDSAEAFFESTLVREPAVLIASATLPGICVAQVIQDLKRAAIELPVIAVGADVDLHAAVEIMRAGAADFIQRPYSAQQLRNAVRNLGESAE